MTEAANSSNIDVADAKAVALKEIQEEIAKKAKDAIKVKLRALETAKQVVKNIEREIADLEQSIADGTF